VVDDVVGTMNCKFLGGPVDGEIRALKTDTNVCQFGQLDEVKEESGEIKTWYVHTYHRAFEGSAYFKYQGRTVAPYGKFPPTTY